MLPQRPATSKDDPRYIPFNSDPSNRTNPFLHRLPPPIPSHTSPRTYFPPSPSFREAHSLSGGHTDPESWAHDRPLVRQRWSPTLPAVSLLNNEPSASRLPALTDLSRRGCTYNWEATSPGSHNVPSSSGSISYPRSPPTLQPLITPMRPPTTAGHSPADCASPSSSKHRGGSPGTDGGVQKKKKRRVALSCAECAKRKQKCNRETPCQHCVARRVPELCVPYSRAAVAAKTAPGEVKVEIPGGSVNGAVHADSAGVGTVSKPPNLLPTLSVRVGRLEAMLNAVVNRVDGLEGKALVDWRINHPPVTTPPPISVEERRRSTAHQRPHTSSSASRPRSDHERDETSADVEVVGEGDYGVGILDRDSLSRNPLPQSMIRPTQSVPPGLDYHGTPAERLQKLFQGCGVSPHKVEDLMADLPPLPLAEDLVGWFFSKVNYVRYPIDERLFRQSFDNLYNGRRINSASVLTMPLIFIVMAIAIRVAPDEWDYTEEQKRTNSLRMYWNSKTAIIMASAVKAENIQLVETHILTGLYLVLMHERRLAEGWAEFRAAVTIGQALGLHRDGKKLGLDQYMTEYRRRLWSYLIHADATYSCLLGRPNSIDPTCVDTLSPSNIDLTDLLDGKKHNPKPMSEPTFATYLILRRGLGLIVAKITQHFQRLQGQTQYRDVEALDSDLKRFVADLPPQFRMLVPDKSYDEALWYLPVHRYYIQTEILHFAIILHRPWLLRRLRSSRYAASRQACFEAAVTDFKIRQAFKRDCPDFFETLLGSSFRAFNAAMIAGISIIIDSRAPHADDMRAIMQSFMEQHPHDPGADDFSKKEAAIIHTLYRRSQELSIRKSFRPQGNVSAERTSVSSSSMPAPPIPQHSDSQDTRTTHSARSSTASLLRGSPYTSTSGIQFTPPGSGSSSEEDQPQRLLDHWLMSNTSFGPSTDITFTNPFPSQPYLPTPDPSTHTTASTDSGSAYMDAGATSGGAMLSIGPAESSQALGGSDGITGPGMAGSDGNNAQFWNALIDGIVGGVGWNGGI